MHARHACKLHIVALGVAHAQGIGRVLRSSSRVRSSARGDHTQPGRGSHGCAVGHSVCSQVGPALRGVDVAIRPGVANVLLAVKLARQNLICINVRQRIQTRVP
jgi:hypothetical protein